MVTRPCGEVYGSLSKSGHPCGRIAGHDFADRFGHVCRCEAERFLESHTTCTPLRAVAGGDR